MFNKDFYPTPENVIETMLLDIDCFGKVVLEPSAGSGNIIDYLRKRGVKEVIACEINDELAKIAANKADRFLANDFLTVTSEQVSHVDFIVMNPPFSNEEKHILHAWNIAPVGCTIVSLCNNSVINGFCSTQAKKEVRDLIDANGRSENFGYCFDTAERKTNVCVGFLTLYKQGNADNEFDGYFSFDDEPEAVQSGIVRHDYIREIVGRYISAVKGYDEVIKVAERINEITAPISHYAIQFGAYEKGKSNYSEITREVFKKDLQRLCWQKIFNDLNMEKYMTTKVRENINAFVEKQTHVPFTMQNIYKMVEIIVGTHGSRMNKILTDAFDEICGFSWKDNCTGGDHWKTNSDYMINRKFIVP